jgi:hypothetical protein
MAYSFKPGNFAGYNDYYKSFDYGIGAEIKRYSRLNPDEYYYNTGVLNYYIGTPRVLSKKTKFIPNLDKNAVKRN